MVATRGGARTGADDQIELNLRKKPVRGTTAKMTATASSTKGKTTRSKKIVPETEPKPELEQSDDELQVDHDDERAPSAPVVKPRKGKTAAASVEPAKTTRKTTTRVKDNESVKPATKAPAKSSRPANVKTTNARTVEAEKPDLPPPARSRGPGAARATRATAAKGKTAPLSPKKITQLKSGPPRNAGRPKATSGRSQEKAAYGSRPASKRRNLSDENADIPEVKPGEDSEDELEAQIAKSMSQVNAKVADKKPAARAPSSIPAQQVESDDELQQDPAREAWTAKPDSEPESDIEEESADELCGPKTPMKRCSPRETLRYASGRKPVPVLGSLVTTPERRVAVLGTQQGTPQTQKPYCRPAVPMSEARPMTVARGQRKPMVFQPLKPLPDLKLNGRHEASEEFGLPDIESTVLPTEIPRVESGPEVSGEFVLDVDQSLTYSFSDDSVMFDVQDVNATKVNTQEATGATEHTITIPQSDIPGTKEASEDPEATIIMQDADVGDGEATLSFETQDSVLITKDYTQIGGVDNTVACNRDVEMSTSTPIPETLIWANVQHDVVIPLNFEAGPGSSGNLSMSLESAKDCCPAAELTAEQEVGKYPTEGAASAEMLSAEDQHSVDVDMKASMHSTGSTRASLNATVNLSDFIDVNSLSESTQAEFTPGEKVVGTALPGNEGQKTAKVFNTTTAPDNAVDASVLEASEHRSSADLGIQSPILKPFTPARDVSQLDIALDDLQGGSFATNVPLYARSTIASRRKSLPAIHARTPILNRVRPKTADGAIVPRSVEPRRHDRPQTPSRKSPAKFGPGTPHDMASTKWLNSKTPKVMTPLARTPGTSVPLSIRLRPSAKTPVARMLFARTPGTSVPTSSRIVPQERCPSRSPRDIFEESSSSAKRSSPTAASIIHQEKLNLDTTPASVGLERFPGLPSRETYDLDAIGGTRTTCEEASTTPQEATEERFPGLPYRRTYEEHAKTAMPASRFRTPAKVPTKRPATTQKTASLRRIALAGASTPNRTPLKAASGTPGHEALTPHPAVPLRGVVAMVEVYTSDGGCASPVFTSLLQRLGAKTTKTFSDRVTHLVFKEGPPNTLQRLRVHNKQVAETGIGNEIQCVNSRWVSDCDDAGMRVSETDEAYAVDVEDCPRSAKRRRKSMEPSSLMNLGGNVVRKSSLGRTSLGRSPAGFNSPLGASPATTKVDVREMENSGEEGSPATPAYLSAPGSLVQQTAPANRVKKLDFNLEKRANNGRRLTFWNGRR